MQDNAIYFHIDLDLLKGKHIFPFHLYTYNPTNDDYSQALPANSPMGVEELEQLHLKLENGEKIAVSKKQQRTFFKFTGLKVNAVTELTLPKNLNPEPIIATNPLSEDLLQCLQKCDFLKIIKNTHDEVSAFSATSSQTVTLAISLARSLLTKDNAISRVAAVSYLMAKSLKISDQEILADIVCAAFLQNLGQTQMELAISRTPVKKMTDHQVLQFKEHPRLTQKFLEQNNISVSPRCLKIILEHHEEVDGEGHSSALALIVGISSRLVEFSMGQNIDDIAPLYSIILNFSS